MWGVFNQVHSQKGIRTVKLYALIFEMEELIKVIIQLLCYLAQECSPNR